MKFLLAILYFYITFRLISWLTLRFLAHKVKSGNDFTNKQTSDHQKDKKRKIFKQDDGDYVDFEEIEKKK